MRSTVLTIACTFTAAPASAQWTHRYPKVEGYAHHVYLEGYELPTMNAGPTDPAPSPDGSRVAFSARGWIWVLDRSTGIATRVTAGGAMDFRPAWSPDGARLAFVRDDTRDTWIVVRDLATGAETVINTPAIELDPVFAPDGSSLYYASAFEGQLDVWRSTFRSGQTERVTARSGIEVKPTVSADGRVLVYLHKGAGDRIVARDADGEETELAAERILSQTRPAVSPDGRTVAYTWPTQDGYELRLLVVDEPSTSLRVTTGRRGLPLAPAWSADGEEIWFTEADDREVMRLYRVARAGGEPAHVPVQAWTWGGPTGTLRIVTRRDGDARPAAARLGVTGAAGHPLVAGDRQAWFDGQNGRVFFYSDGIVELTVPAGRVTVGAVQGLATPEATATVEVAAGETAAANLTLTPVWDARAAGYLSGDHHFHLNYGGPFRLVPEDLFPMLAGEGLDVATPLLANLHNRFEHQEHWTWRHAGALPLVAFAQEVRSHFLGHLGVLGVSRLFWPWIWGPGYQVYGADDRPNTVVLAFARAQGGLGGYVHPFSPTDTDPFSEEGMRRVPIMLPVDGVRGAVDWLEVACLWSDELGTAQLWYRFLNLGIPMALEAGTDVMNDFYRTMAVGTTRLYVRTDGADHFDAYWQGLREGRSFVTNGPMLEFAVGDAGPGGVARGGRGNAFSLRVASAVPVERVEVLVNGRVVWSDSGLAAPGTRDYRGRVDLPAGGWVAARAHGGATVWPAMDSYPFAHTGPVWIGTVGSTDPAARRAAAGDLLRLLDVAEARAVQGYGDTPIPRIRGAFAEARERLRAAAR